MVNFLTVRSLNYTIKRFDRPTFLLLSPKLTKERTATSATKAIERRMFYPHRTSMRRQRPNRLRTDRTGRGPPSPHSTEGVLKTSAGIKRSRDYLLLADFDSEPRPVFAGPRLKPPKWVRMSDRTLALDGLLACLILTGIKGQAIVSPLQSYHLRHRLYIALLITALSILPNFHPPSVDIRYTYSPISSSQDSQFSDLLS